MTSRERVMRAINHQEVDRVPIFYSATKEINDKLEAHCGKDSREAMLEQFNVDVRFIRPPVVPVQGEKRYGFSLGSVHAKLHNQGGKTVLEKVKLPLEDMKTVDDVNNWKWPDPDWFEYKIPEKLHRQWGDKAVFADGMGILLLVAMGLRGMEQMMMDMAAEPEMAHAILGRIADFNMERMRRYVKANEGLIEIMGVGDDIAGQDGMFFSHAMWQEFIKPLLKKQVDLCHELKVVPYFHGCGGYRELFPEFIEMGLTCVGRFQTEAKGNDFADIKETFGKEICIWGGIDAQHILIEDPPEKVKAHVREIVSIGSPGSGFIAGPTHTFTEDTPIENVVAMYDTLAEENWGGKEAA